MPLTRRSALLALASWAGACPARPPGDMMLAREAAIDVDPRGWLVSEKFDGVRAQWDGRRLRFRGGDAVAAPDWFTARLPAQMLDGELWLARGRFESLMSTVRRTRPDDVAWRSVRYLVFDQPATQGAFAERANRLHALVQAQACDWLVAVEQGSLDSPAALQRRLQQVIDAQGEGLILHRADALWQPGRSDALLKLKPVHDAEAVVIGHLPGKGRHEGRIGALKVRTSEGVTFVLGTGLSDALRQRPPRAGTTVTFTHRGYTAGGVPRFASFLRLRDG